MFLFKVFNLFLSQYLLECRKNILLVPFNNGSKIFVCWCSFLCGVTNLAEFLLFFSQVPETHMLTSYANLKLSIGRMSFKTVQTQKHFGKQLKSSKETLKLLLFFFLHVNDSTNTVHTNLTPGSFPDEWKTAKVTSVHKKSSKQDYKLQTDFSLPIPSKVIERFKSERYICSILKDHL